MTDINRTQALSKGDSAAYKALREKYSDEFNAVKQARVAELGFEWSPRKSDEDKAREQVASILANYPGIRSDLFDQVQTQIAQQQIEKQAGSVVA